MFYSKGCADIVCDMIAETIVKACNVTWYGFNKVEVMLNKNYVLVNITVNSDISYDIQYIKDAVCLAVYDAGYTHGLAISAFNLDIEVNIIRTDYVESEIFKTKGYAFNTPNNMPTKHNIELDIILTLDNLANQPDGIVDIGVCHSVDVDDDIIIMEVEQLPNSNADEHVSSIRRRLLGPVLNKYGKQLPKNTLINQSLPSKLHNRLHKSFGVSGRQTQSQYSLDNKSISGLSLSDIKRLATYYSRHIALYMQQILQCDVFVVELVYYNAIFSKVKAYSEDKDFSDYVASLFPFQHSDIYNLFNLKNIQDNIYAPLACYGAFGYYASQLNLPWETLNKETLLKIKRELGK